MRKAVLGVLAAAVLLPVSGCGGDDKGDPIPSAQAARIIGRLEEAKRRDDPLRCDDLQNDTIPALRDQVAALPDATDSDIKTTLNDGIDHLADLVSQDCENKQTTTETTPTETTTESTPSTTESTPSTETTNTETTNTDTNTNTNTDTNTDTTPTSGGTPGPGGQTSGGKKGDTP